MVQLESLSQDEEEDYGLTESMNLSYRGILEKWIMCKHRAEQSDGTRIPIT